MLIATCNVVLFETESRQNFEQLSACWFFPVVETSTTLNVRGLSMQTDFVLTNYSMGRRDWKNSMNENQVKKIHQDIYKQRHRKIRSLYWRLSLDSAWKSIETLSQMYQLEFRDENFGY